MSSGNAAHTVDRQAAAAAIEAFLRAIGRDGPDLQGTGARVAAMFVDDLCSGYSVDTAKLVADSIISAPAPPPGSTGVRAAMGALVVVRDIPMVTTCPHHLVPSIGSATVAFKAKAHLLGLGTIAALVDAHARRLALQEHIGEAVVADLETALDPSWVGCRITLSHACMIVRGERAHGTRVETVALRGPADSIAEAHGALGVGAER
jgi:GTP cyclohydrolase IA